MKYHLNLFWLLILSGVFFITIGSIALINPVISFIHFTTYAGICILVNGFFLLIIYLTNTFIKDRKWIMVESLNDIVIGIILAFNPLFTIITFPFFVGFWLIIKGLTKLLGSIAISKNTSRWMYIFIAGLCLLVFGLFIEYFSFPKATHMIETIGVLGIIIGFINIVLALSHKHIQDEVSLIF